ncbi:nuclear transport factor 2 family protein [Chryseobacterium sp. PTM-20240506]|uniref:nuclear transport factor 2 family protein n=1 Tax=unclassified Chryseobacterium TaxID=2593645 RepID=UPI00235A3F30|nr:MULTISPECIES: nuclear transport factor 2 family protein [unclassified Chryseobacterium]MDC8103488.1 nuclear transport factor 2 family protein [Chryseobacterium sp. B21-037]MDQ1803041.1 nuclear transport factor 2 family protein [Chryseobacterium sp. CKR4-1]
MQQIKQTIEKFIKAGDTSDTNLMDEVLHKDYQNIQDGFFEQKGIFIISKEQYIEYISNKTFGGKPRTLAFDSIEQKGNIAIAKLSLESDVLRFSSTITCIQEDEKWQVITNIPVIEKK